MDFLFEGFEKIVSSYLWKSLIPEFRWVDWIMILFIASGLMYGAKRGLMTVTAEIFALMLAMALVMNFYGEPAKVLAHYSTELRTKYPGSILARYVGNMHADYYQFMMFLILAFLFVLLIFGILEKLKKVFHTKLAGPLRILGGALSGGVLFFLIWGFISQALLLLPNPGIRHSYEKESGAYFGSSIARICPAVYKWVKEPFEFFGK